MEGKESDKWKGGTYISVGRSTGLTVELVPREIGIVATVDEVVGERVGQIDGCRGRRGARGPRAHVLEELIVVRWGREFLSL